MTSVVADPTISTGSLEEVGCWVCWDSARKRLTNSRVVKYLSIVIIYLR